MLISSSSNAKPPNAFLRPHPVYFRTSRPPTLDAYSSTYPPVHLLPPSSSPQQRFAAVVMRIREPKTTALIFASGKMVVTGAKSEDDSRLASRKYARIIQKLGFDAKFAEFKIQNIVGSCDVKFPIRLEGLAFSHGAFSSYEPEVSCLAGRAGINDGGIVGDRRRASIGSRSSSSRRQCDWGEIGRCCSGRRAILGPWLAGCLLPNANLAVLSRPCEISHDDRLVLLILFTPSVQPVNADPSSSPV